MGTEKRSYEISTLGLLIIVFAIILIVAMLTGNLELLMKYLN